MNKLKQYQMFINGEWVDSENKKTFETLNPENNEPWAKKYSDEKFVNYKTNNLAEFLKKIKTFENIIIENFNDKIDENIGLLHIPVLFKYRVGTRFEIYGGPESQFLLSVEGIDINKDKKYKKFILAATAGVGILISDEFTIDARYNLAISNYIDFGYHTNKKLNFIQIGLAYKFDN